MAKNSYSQAQIEEWKKSWAETTAKLKAAYGDQLYKIKLVPENPVYRAKTNWREA